MRIVRGALIGIVALVVVGASFAAITARAGDETTSWVAVLSGDNELPARDTRGHGVAIFHLSEDGQSIEYMLIVANIENVVASHIHIGAAGDKGPS